jgi:hypothetical protein
VRSDSTVNLSSKYHIKILDIYQIIIDELDFEKGCKFKDTLIEQAVWHTLHIVKNRTVITEEDRLFLLKRIATFSKKNKADKVLKNSARGEVSEMYRALCFSPKLLSRKIARQA